MNRLYLTYNEKNAKREYYSYTVLKDNPVYITLNPNEIEGYLKRILSRQMKNIRSINANLMELELATGEIIILDGIKLFKSNDQFDPYFDELKNRIKKSIEESNIKAYKQSLPKGYIPQVNRKRKTQAKYLISDERIELTLLLEPSREQEIVDLSNTNVYNSEVTKGL